MTTLLMSTCGTRRPTFTYSFADSDGIGSSGAPDTSWFSGDGEIVFVMSLDKIGNPQSGGALRDISVLALQFAHADTVCLPAVIQGNDGAGPGTYTMGSCVLAAPSAPPSTRFRAGPPVPNPATHGLHLALEVPPEHAGGRFESGVFDVTGRLVRRLGGHEAVAPRSQIDWDLRDDSGKRVRAGSYWIRIRIGGRIESRLVMVLQ